MAEMTDKQLIGYARGHCRTERALFSGRHINRLLELAGSPPDYVARVDSSRWLSLGPDLIDPLCDAAEAGAATTQGD